MRPASRMHHCRRGVFCYKALVSGRTVERTTGVASGFFTGMNVSNNSLCGKFVGCIRLQQAVSKLASSLVGEIQRKDLPTASQPRQESLDALSKHESLAASCACRHKVVFVITVDHIPLTGSKVMHRYPPLGRAPRPTLRRVPRRRWGWSDARHRG